MENGPQCRAGPILTHLAQEGLYSKAGASGWVIQWVLAKGGQIGPTSPDGKQENLGCI